MSSRKVEDVHTEVLKKLLSDSGLICIRPAPESLESSTISGESDEHELQEEEEEASPEVQYEEEAQPEVIEEMTEEPPYLFPTPSLRRMLPERLRKIDTYNRIHVLPLEFKTEIDPLAIPKIATTAQQKYIDILGQIVGCDKYKISLAEFWFLDTLANLLRRAQEDELHRPTQAILILWFCEWMKEMQHFDAADRQRMLRRFKDNMLAAAQVIGISQNLPTPQGAGVYYEVVEETELPARSNMTQRMSSVSPRKSGIATEYLEKHLVTFESASYECSLRDLTKIIHYIYDLFSTDYQYDLVRSIFTFSPEYVLIDAPYQIVTPKRLYAPLKIKPKKEKSPRKDAKGGKGKKNKEPDTEEFLALMALKARDEREQDEQEEKDREDWNRRSRILPLNFAATDAFFDKYWPPPPPEPEPEPEPEPKKPPKGKKK